MKFRLARRRSFDVDRLFRYAGQDMRSVEGWLSGDAVWPIIEIAQQQLADGSESAIGEIGVHHGQLFLLLALASTNDEPCVGVDLFENQQENIDNSGHGDRDILEGHLKRFGLANGRVELLQRNSMTLSGAELVSAAAGRKFRLFSVDGGHTPDITVNDLHLAAEIMTDDGVIILDDVFSQMWPGVMTGFTRFMNDNPGRLFPFALCGNKTLISTSQAMADRWRAHLEPAAGYFMSRSDALLDHPVQILMDGPGLPNLWHPRR